MRSADPSYAEALDGHYARTWSEPTHGLRLDRGPAHQLPDDFTILVMRRSSDTDAYATRCMSLPTDAECVELHLLSRPGQAPDPSLVELLTIVAHYHRTGSRLGLGHSVNFGRPWVTGSSCTHGLISLPYLDGPKLEWLTSPRVRFLWLIPVTEAEVRFKKVNGVEALEQRFEEARFDYLDPLRPSVV